uniref:Gustatory receptor n=1 Tax=Acrobeloides nanus TaxID=290746 RepID=A0A914EDY8_9BILA
MPTNDVQSYNSFSSSYGSSWGNENSEYKQQPSSNRTIPDYDDTFLYICGIYSNYVRTVAVITILLFPLMVYMLVWKSPQEMKTYKWLLMNNVITGFLYVLLFGVWLPVPVFFDGIICAFSLGPSRLDSKWNYVMLEVSILLFLNLSLSYVASLIYQYTLIMPTSLLGNLPKSPKRFILVYISYTIIIDTILIFLSNFHRDNTHLLFHKLYDKPVWINAPELLKSIYHNEKSMVAFSYSTNEIVIIFGSVLFLTILIETIVIFGLNFKVLKTIRGMNIKLHDRVKLIQQTLYRILYQKTIILMLFFFVPFLVVCIARFELFERSFNLALADCSLIEKLIELAKRLGGLPVFFEVVEYNMTYANMVIDRHFIS